MKPLTQAQYPGLPKWPGVFITGKSVTPEQAKEIIFRTDTSVARPSDYMGGNDHAFQKRCATKFGWGPYLAFDKHMFTREGEEGYDIRLKQDAILETHGFDNVWALGDAWKAEMGMIDTQYVYNSYLSNAYIGGPCGWMSLNGNIHWEGHNYGKWPSVEDIENDWKALATAFPYIDLVCTLFNEEAMTEGGQPVCSIVVRDGHVTVCEPDLALHDRNIEPKKFEDQFGGFLGSLMRGGYSHEQGWPAAWIDEFAVKSTAAMKKVAPFLFNEYESSAVEIVQPPK